ncbi:MAG TPA: DUF1800 domain-containing protein [Gemmatimonadaceae bacterium]
MAVSDEKCRKCDRKHRGALETELTAHEFQPSTGCGKREAGSGRREAAGGKREAGSGKREAGSGKREAGSGRETRNTMLITKQALVLAVLLSTAPIGAYAQKSDARSAQKSAIARSDVRELPADQQVIQALNRLTFGPRPGDVAKVRAMGLDNWIDLQLHPDKINDNVMNSFIDAKYAALGQDQNELLKQYAVQQRERREVKRDRADSIKGMTADDSAIMMQLRQQQNSRRQVVTQLQSSRVARAVGSERQLQEVMTDFWENHFNIYLAKGPPEAYYLVDFDQNVIRPNALGKFRDLLEAVAKSPAMLFYLDNARSMADSTRPTLETPKRVRLVPLRRGRFGRVLSGGVVAIPGQMPTPQQRRAQGLNENYGRELLELHTLGVDGGYTQQDVINVARAFTGWTIVPPAQGGGFIFRPQVHDAGEKVVLGHRLAAGRGMEDGEDVLDILSRSPATAHFIAFKLARRFVTDTPSKALVDHAAQIFLRTDGDIREVLRTIITSPEFFSQRAFRSKVKSPFEVVVSAARAMNAQPDSTPRSAQIVAYLGQPIFGHQAPNGWPETGDAWMNTGAILNRINFGMAAAAGLLPGVSVAALPALDTLRSAPRDKQVDAVAATILNGMVSPDTRSVLLSGEHPLLNGATGSSASTMSGDSVDDDSDQMVDRANGTPARVKNQNGGGKRTAMQGRGPGYVPQLTGLSQIVGLALGSPEFQRH